MVFLWILVYWVLLAVVVVGTFVSSGGKHSPGKLLAIFLFAGGAVLFLTIPLINPHSRFVQIGVMGDGRIVVDRLNDVFHTGGAVTGDHVHIANRNHVVVFTEDTEKVGMFRWAFRWREYRSIKDDVKSIIGERNGLIYFVSDSTGKIKTMKK